MSEVNNPQNPHNLDIVREILLGQHSAAVDARLKALEGALDSRLEAQRRSAIEHLENTNVRFAQFEQAKEQSEQSIIASLRKFEGDVQQHLTTQREVQDRKQDQTGKLFAEEQAERKSDTAAIRAELDLMRDAMLAMSEHFNHMATRLTVLRARTGAASTGHSA